MSNPFPLTPSNPGGGFICLAFQPPKSSVLRTLTYQYPLKLIAPRPLLIAEHLIHTIFLLTYGGGLVAGDSIALTITLEAQTRLVLLTQGSTKIFKSPKASIVSVQELSLDIGPGAALCYLPDPVQPFARSAFRQTQRYNLRLPAPGTSDEPSHAVQTTGSLCALDWVSQGRSANGEDWDFSTYASSNEIWLHQASAGQPADAPKPRLMLRDNILLSASATATTSTLAEDPPSLSPRMDGLGVFGTLLLHGPVFTHLGFFFMDEFKALPRIGGRKWDASSDDDDDEDSKVDALEAWRRARLATESADSVLWTAAAVRACVVVKFGAREVEGARKWLRSMLVREGSVGQEFGEGALLCLR